MKRQIPNILSVLRLIMIPVFVILYFNYREIPGAFFAAGIYILAWATDVLDGYLARRNGWITEAGKILDPLADKLMQLTVAICYTVDDIIFLALLIPTVIKEIAMLIGAYIVIKKQKHVEPSHWYGKAASVILFLCSLTRIIVRGNFTLDVVLCCIMVSVMLAALTLYYFKDFRGKFFGKQQNP
ncbi:MAG: CDP-alcohol phosphatidyltransferase family protein [Clostridia bacterium]|nr:CDP-alcohol phosphatidyltransferase family protein [Clostridia bacterium]